MSPYEGSMTLCKLDHPRNKGVPRSAVDGGLALEDSYDAKMVEGETSE
jgi:hypothetical protein